MCAHVFNIHRYLFLVEKEITSIRHIGLAMMLSRFLLSRQLYQPVSLSLIENEEDIQDDTDPPILPDAAVFEFVDFPVSEELLDLSKGDYDYIRSDHVHFLDYNDYQREMDLINMSETESVDLSLMQSDCSVDNAFSTGLSRY